MVDKALLCSACRVLERLNYDFDENPDLSRWWDNHKREDAERVKKEEKQRLREEAAKELTKKPFNELSDEDKILLRECGYY